MSEPTRQPDERPCARWEEALALHVEGDLSPEEARELELHLDRCPVCAAFLAGLRESQEALGGLVDPPPNDSVTLVHRRVMEAVRREGTVTRSPAWRWAAAAAVLLILGAALVGRLAFRTGGPEESPAAVVAVSPNERPPTATEEPATPEPPSTEHAPLDEEPLDEEPSPGAGSTDEPTPTAPEGPRPTPAPRRLQPPQPEIQRAGLDGSQDLKIQLVSDDPDIVIYWLVDTEDTPHATPTT